MLGIAEDESSVFCQDGLREAEPNAAHRALVELEDLGKLRTVPWLLIRIGFWGPLYYTYKYNKEPPT